MIIFVIVCHDCPAAYQPLIWFYLRDKLSSVLNTSVHTFRTAMPGQRMIRDEDIPEGIKPVSINPLGNYAVQVS